MLWVYGHYNRLYTSELDAYRRQMLTYEDRSRAERVDAEKGMLRLTASPVMYAFPCGVFRIASPFSM